MRLHDKHGRYITDVRVSITDRCNYRCVYCRTGNQGAVVQAAREKARAFLRAGEDFVSNATNVSREIRTQVIDLLAA